MEAKPPPPIHQKTDGSISERYLCYTKGNCVICSDEAFCLIFITNLTTINSVMLHNESVIKEKRNNTHITSTFMLDICPQVRYKWFKGVWIVHI